DHRHRDGRQRVVTDAAHHVFRPFEGLDAGPDKADLLAVLLAGGGGEFQQAAAAVTLDGQLQGLACTGLDSRYHVHQPIVDRRIIDGHDQVTGLQAGGGRGTVRADLTDQRRHRRLPAGQAQGRHRVGLFGTTQPVLQLQGKALGRTALAFPGLQLQLPGLTEAADQLEIDLVPGRRGGTINLENLQPFVQPGTLGDTARLDRPDHRRHGGDTQNGDNPERDYRQQEVGGWAGGHDGNALFDGLAIERLVKFMFRHGRFTLVEHLDVATQGHAGNDVFGALAVIPAVQRRAKSDGETQYLDAAATGDPEMPVLVNGDQQPQRHDGGQQSK